MKFPPARPVIKLVRQHDVARVVLFLEAANGGDGDDPSDAERAERPDICPVVDLVRSDPVPTRMTRKKKDRPAVKRSPDDRVRRIPKGRVDPDLGNLLKPVNLVKAAASNNADGGGSHFLAVDLAVDLAVES